MPPKNSKKQKKSEVIDDETSETPSIKKQKVNEELEKENINEKIDKNDVKEINKLEKFDLTNISDIKSFVYEHNSMHMPDDFYDFLDFCKSINSSDPKNALSVINIELVGIYDLILSGLKVDYKLHDRYFFDPPEFQTVLKVNNETKLHYGYFRDDPNQLPDFVGINDEIDCKIISKGENLFSAMNWYLEDLLKKKENKQRLNKLNDLKKKLNDWSEKGKHTKELKTSKMKNREKSINAKTLHGAGIVVPVDSDGCGYREIPETYDSLKKIFSNICLEKGEKNKSKISKAENSLQELVNLVQFANDECDPGMGLELGICMFSFGKIELHKYVKNLMTNGYNLLNRNHYADIIKSHLAQRNRLN